MRRREFLLRSFTSFISMIEMKSFFNFFENSEEPFPSKERREDLKKVITEALSRGGDYADIYFERKVRRRFVLEDGKLEEVHIGWDMGTGVRVVKGESTGYSYTDSFELKEILEAAKVAREIAKGPLVPFRGEFKSRKPRGIIKVKLPLEAVKETERIEKMYEAEETARGVSTKIHSVKIVYEETIRKIAIFNSEGVFAQDFSPIIFFTVEALAEEGGKRHRGRRRISRKGGFEFFEVFDIRKTAKDAAFEAVTMLEAREAPAGEFPVVLVKGWGGILFHEAIGHGLEGDFVRIGTSFYSDKLGKEVASPLVTLVDDGTIENARGSMEYDDEGTPSRRNILIENGKLVCYMTDRLSARILRLERTGNARRQSYRFPPIVRMTNTFILEGDAKPEEIIRETKRGVYAKGFSGGEVDVASGNFTFSVREAYMIENGRVTYPVKGATLIGSGQEILKEIDMIGNDLDFGPGTCGKSGQLVPVTSGQPTLRIRKITVGGSAR